MKHVQRWHLVIFLAKNEEDGVEELDQSRHHEQPAQPDDLDLARLGRAPDIVRALPGVQTEIGKFTNLVEEPCIGSCHKNVVFEYDTA